MTIKWCVMHGPDKSHLWDVNWFDRLADAQIFASALPLSPHGFPRPYQIERWEYLKSTVYGDTARCKIVVPFR